MTIESGGQAPYTTVAAMLTVLDWFREKGTSDKLDAEALIRAGVPESLGRRTSQSLVALGLISKEGVPTTQFLDLQSIRGVDEYKNRCQEWLKATYADVLKYCDPTKDSFERVSEAFRGYEPKGQRSGMVSLFLGLWKYAGLTTPGVSSTAPSRPTTSTPRKKPVNTPARSRQSRLNNESDTGLDSNGIAPALIGLLRQVPSEKRSWTTAQRDSFIDAIRAVLDFLVPIDDSPAVASSSDETEDD
jgi:hypothetical protein